MWWHVAARFENATKNAIDFIGVSYNLNPMNGRKINAVGLLKSRKLIKLRQPYQRTLPPLLPHFSILTFQPRLPPSLSLSQVQRSSHTISPSKPPRTLSSSWSTWRFTDELRRRYVFPEATFCSTSGKKRNQLRSKHRVVHTYNDSERRQQTRRRKQTRTQQQKRYEASSEIGYNLSVQQLAR